MTVIENYVIHEYRMDNAIQEIKLYTDPVRGSSGMTVWDSGISLAKYFEHLSSNGHLGKQGAKFNRVLELGCGTGIVGLTLSRLLPETKVVLTDKPEVLDLCRKTLELHPYPNVFLEPLRWEDQSNTQSVIDKHGSFDTIIFSDLIAWPELYKSLTETLKYICGYETTVIFANEKRDFGVEAEFYRLLGKEFTFSHVKPEEQHPVYQCEDIYIFVAKKKNEV